MCEKWVIGPNFLTLLILFLCYLGINSRGENLVYKWESHADHDLNRYSLELDDKRAKFAWKQEFSEKVTLLWQWETLRLERTYDPFSEDGGNPFLGLENAARLQLDWHWSDRVQTRFYNRERQQTMWSGLAGFSESWTAVETNAQVFPGTQLQLLVSQARKDRAQGISNEDKVQLSLRQKAGNKAQFEIIPSYSREFNIFAKGFVYETPALANHFNWKITPEISSTTGIRWLHRARQGTEKSQSLQEVQNGFRFQPNQFWKFQWNQGYRELNDFSGDAAETFYSRSSVQYDWNSNVQLLFEATTNYHLKHPARNWSKEFYEHQFELKFSPRLRDLHGFDAQLDLQYKFDDKPSTAPAKDETGLQLMIQRQF